MRQIVQLATGPEEQCIYLPDQRSQLRYRVIDECAPETYLSLLERGWRRFGSVFFRPACAACRECRSLRIDVERFVPNRSMRRCLKQNQDLNVALRLATVTDRHIDLYNRYHHDMAERKDWSEKSIEPLNYYRTFVQGHGDFGHELIFIDGDRPVAIALVDLLPRAISAVYCYYDPESRHRSLGVYSVLRQIELARERGVPYVYLGYWIEGNASMRYKANYRPHEILEGRPKLDDEPIWPDATVGQGPTPRT